MVCPAWGVITVFREFFVSMLNYHQMETFGTVSAVVTSRRSVLCSRGVENSDYNISEPRQSSESQWNVR